MTIKRKPGACSATGIIAINRAIELPADSSQAWCHMAPFGAFMTTLLLPNGKQERKPLLYGRENFELVVDRVKALNAQTDFRGLRINMDHLAHHETGTTASFGQAKDAEIRGDGSSDADGLYYLVEFNPAGAIKVRNREFSYLSGEFDIGDFDDGSQGIVAPDEKWAGALTNDPNLPIKAFNRAPTSGQPASAGSSTKKPAAKAAKGKNTMDYKAMLIDLLGLKATASDEEIEAAFKVEIPEEEAEHAEGGEAVEAKPETKAMHRLIRLQAKKLADQKQAKLAGEADAFCDTHKAKIHNRAAVREQFLADPVGTKKIFEAFAPAAATATKALNRAEAQTPGERDTAEPDAAKKQRKQMQDADIESVRVRFSCRNRAEAATLARQMNPTLHT